MYLCMTSIVSIIGVILHYSISPQKYCKPWSSLYPRLMPIPIQTYHSQMLIHLYCIQRWWYYLCHTTASIYYIFPSYCPSILSVTVCYEYITRTGYLQHSTICRWAAETAMLFKMERLGLKSSGFDAFKSGQRSKVPSAFTSRHNGRVFCEIFHKTYCARLAATTQRPGNMTMVEFLQ